MNPIPASTNQNFLLKQNPSVTAHPGNQNSRVSSCSAKILRNKKEAEKWMQKGIKLCLKSKVFPKKSDKRLLLQVAAIAFRKSSKLDPTNVSPFNAEGQTLLERIHISKNPEKVLEELAAVLKKSLEIAPDQVNILRYYAATLLKLHTFNLQYSNLLEAELALDKSKEIKPSCLTSQYILEEVLKKQEEFLEGNGRLEKLEKVERELKLYLEKEKDHPSAQKHLGTCLISQAEFYSGKEKIQKLEEAEEIFKQLREIRGYNRNATTQLINIGNIKRTTVTNLINDGVYLVNQAEFYSGKEKIQKLEEAEEIFKHLREISGYNRCAMHFLIDTSMIKLATVMNLKTVS